jgi:hypothetical protein
MDGEKPVNRKQLEKRPACSVKSAPFPVEAICSKCLADNELWSDETETTCTECGNLINMQ